MAVPGEVGGGFTRARRRIGVGRQAPRGLGGAEQAPGFGLADDDVAGGKIEQELSARHSCSAGRRLRHPDVLANFQVEGERRLALGLEQQVDAKGRDLSRDLDVASDYAGAGGEPAPLIEFAVIGQVGFRDHAQHAAALDRQGAIIEPSLEPERRPHRENRAQACARPDEFCEACLHRGQQGLLQVQIVDGVSGET